MAEVSLLRDSWTELDFLDVVSGTAQGDHATLAAVLAWLKEQGVHAEARVFDWRGAPHDQTVHANQVYAVTPFLTIRLGYACALSDAE